jgi:hypothetical protein
MVTYHGSPAGFIVGGAIAMITSPFWGMLYAKVLDHFAPLVLGRPLSQQAREAWLRTLTLGVILIGALLLGLGFGLK